MYNVLVWYLCTRADTIFLALVCRYPFNETLYGHGHGCWWCHVLRWWYGWPVHADIQCQADAGALAELMFRYTAQATGLLVPIPRYVDDCTKLSGCCCLAGCTCWSCLIKTVSLRVWYYKTFRTRLHDCYCLEGLPWHRPNFKVGGSWVDPLLAVICLKGRGSADCKRRIWVYTSIACCSWCVTHLQSTRH